MKSLRENELVYPRISIFLCGMDQMGIPNWQVLSKILEIPPFLLVNSANSAFPANSAFSANSLFSADSALFGNSAFPVIPPFPLIPPSLLILPFPGITGIGGI